MFLGILVLKANKIKTWLSQRVLARFAILFEKYYSPRVRKDCFQRVPSRTQFCYR